jgi:hypothetical protein
VREDPERYFDLFVKAPLATAFTAGPTIIICLLIGRAAGLGFTAAIITSIIVGAIPGWLVYRHYQQPPQTADWGPKSDSRKPQ